MHCQLIVLSTSDLQHMLEVGEAALYAWSAITPTSCIALRLYVQLSSREGEGGGC